MASRIVAPRSSKRFVGRSDILNNIAHTIARIESNGSQILAISGPAGIGKSRLIREIVRRFEDRYDNPPCLFAESFENDRGVPYAPVIDLLRKELNGAHEERIRSTMAHLNADLSSIMPELDSGEHSTGAHAELSREHLQYLISQLLSSCLLGQPSLLIVEDLHWCDDLTLELLERLSRDLRESSALIIISFRDDEIQPALQQLLVHLNRERRLIDVQVGPLDRGDVA
ncbi:MAG: AAA family ATPase, partial [Chloroflexota bacterium]